MADTYQVVGAAALITQQTVNGPMKTLLYNGHIIGVGATQAEIDHNVAAGLIRKISVDADRIAPNSPYERHPSELEPVSEPAEDATDVVVEPVDPTDPVAPADAGDTAVVETDTTRADARAKLPADGSAPGKAASKAVWVEYAVVKGYDFDTCMQSGRDELIALTASA